MKILVSQKGQSTNSPLSVIQTVPVERHRRRIKMFNSTLSGANAKKCIMLVRNFANNTEASLDHRFQFVHELLVVKVPQLVADKVMGNPLYLKWRQRFQVSHQNRAVIKLVKVSGEKGFSLLS
jgi:hypothetical protein